ncbi:innexin unc-9-like [Mya arenaria]|uniref:innexin unc-9-like n=1 Tax=Mya arenaria TaxID=6604 RepID=UPI0022E606F2|nr:innexin unc-9-like [Mya arenaria]
MPTVSRGLYNWLFRRSAALEDMADRLSHVWTVGLLLVLAAVTSWRQAFSRTIECFCPAEFTSNHVRAVEAMCWGYHGIKNLPFGVQDDRSLNFVPLLVRTPPLFPLSDSYAEETETTYYQWIPVILVFQALLFKLPIIVMYVCQTFSGISFDKIAGLGVGYEYLNTAERFLLARQIARYMTRWCKQCAGIPCRQLTLLWLFVKILFCVNIIIQLTILDDFLVGSDTQMNNVTSYGDVISSNLIENNATLWKVSRAFPRDAMCDVSIVMIKNVHRYSFQCHLPLNNFNEHAYQLLWVWLVFVAVVTYVSLGVWVLRTIIPIFRKRYLVHALEVSDVSPEHLFSVRR